MFRAYKYECKHFLTDKVFFILLVVCLYYASFILQSETILGVANTAPFSAWSFGGYLAALLPFACACLLALFAIAYSDEQRLAEQITAATPTSKLRRSMTRLAAMYSGFALLMVCALVLAGWFYLRVFDFASPLQWLAPFVYAVMPALLFITGLAMQLGRFGSGGIYALMAFLLLYGLFGSNVSLPLPIDLFGSSFFRSAPAIINGIDPAFHVSLAAAGSRVLLSCVGLTGIFLSGLGKKRH